MSSRQDLPAHLEPSRLGTKEYWDALYTTEIANHSADPSDTGTVWFDDSAAEAKVLEYLGRLAGDGNDCDEDEEVEGRNPSELTLDRATTSFLDLGCGNGSLLFALRDDGWEGSCVGVDYSEQSVELARRVAADRRRRKRGRGFGSSGEEEVGQDVEEQDAGEGGAGDGSPEVEFTQWDVLNGPLDKALAGAQSDGFDVVLDKGTFDAVCLSGEEGAEAGRRASEGYRARVTALLRDGGCFVITSCNWTEEELRRWFEQEGSGARLEMAGRVAYGTFSFGGAKGQTISTVCFRKKEDTIG